MSFSAHPSPSPPLSTMVLQGHPGLPPKIELCHRRSSDLSHRCMAQVIE